MGMEAEFLYSDLVDIDAFASLLESFYTATGIPNGLVGVNGELLTQAGWVNACANFHRDNPETNRRCQQSNLDLMRDLRDGQIASAICENGLIDYATPVVIEGHQLATLFLGQVLNEPPDRAFFREQAKQVGFDETEYMAAINEVPIVSRAQMEALMECMKGMAQMLAASGLARLRQNSLEFDLHRTTKQRIQLEDILNSAPVGIGWSNTDGRIEYVNRQFTKLYGYTLEDLPDLDTWLKLAHPDPEYRKSVIEPWQKKVDQARADGVEPPELEAHITCKDGRIRHAIIRMSWVGNKRLCNFNDMTAHWKSEQRNHAHDRMLEMVARGASLQEILLGIVNIVESEAPDSLCSVLLVDQEGKHLLTGVGPSLPEDYSTAINGIEIGMGVGSCGTAVHLGQRVVTENIMTHEYWQPYKHLAQQANLGACWSEPIFDTEGHVLGVFGIYHKEPATPTQEDIERISFAANLAAIAIENKNAHDELEHQAYHDYLTGLANRRFFIERAEVELSRVKRYGGQFSLIMFDIDHFKMINDTHGHSVGDLVLKKIAEICQSILRDIDITGRIGGEEFALLLPHTDPESALDAARRIHAAFSESHVQLQNGKTINFTASFGVVASGKTTTIDELLKLADKALYQAKKTGRNRVCMN